MTKRSARIFVRNETGSTIVGVSVLHKYSDEHKNRREWGIIENGTWGDGELTAEFNTGFLTTGKDWWYVSFFGPDMKTYYYSNPSNFRGIIDGLEHIAPTALSAAAGGIVALGTSWSGPAAVAAGVAAATAAQAVNDSLFNSESTDGYKQHILREEDEGYKQGDTWTEILLRNDGTIAFRSKSGDSETVYSSKKI